MPKYFDVDLGPLVRKLELGDDVRLNSVDIVDAEPHRIRVRYDGGRPGYPREADQPATVTVTVTLNCSRHSSTP